MWCFATWSTKWFSLISSIFQGLKHYACGKGFTSSAFILMYSSEAVDRQKYFSAFHSLKKKSHPSPGIERGRGWRKYFSYFLSWVILLTCQEGIPVECCSANFQEPQTPQNSHHLGFPLHVAALFLGCTNVS